MVSTHSSHGETIYNGFGSTKGLLRAAMDAAVVGDTEPVPYGDRPEFLDLGKGMLDRLLSALDSTAPAAV